MKCCRILAACLPLILLTNQFAHTQVTTGMPPYGSFHSPSPRFETIDLANNNVHFAIPIFSRAGRGSLPFYYALQYDSSVWQPVTSNGTTSWQPANSTWGWRTQTDAATGYATYQYLPGSPCPIYANWSYIDPQGTSHYFGGSIVSSSCGTPYQGQGVINDGSGYSYTHSVINGVPSIKIYPRNGGELIPPIQNPNAAGTYYVYDSNGNFISSTVSGSTTTIYDTLSSSSAVLTISGSGTVNYTYPTHTGTANIVVQYEPYTVATSFSAPHITEYPRTAVSLPYTITLADNTQYTFTYEKTPGPCTPLSGTYATNCVTARIGSVTLPTGGTITYSYSTGYNGIWTDGTTTGVARTNSIDGGSGWQYIRTNGGANNTITDSQGNQSYLNFSGLYEWQRQIYTGAINPSNLIETILNCYNGNFGTACTTNQSVSAPISERYTYTELPGPTGKWNLHAEFYNTTNGLTTGTQDYDFGQGTSGNELQQSAITYGTFGTSPSYFYLPTDVKVEDANGNVLAHSQYYYDEAGTLTGTSGVTQHGSPPTTSRGNLTSAYTTTSVQGGGYLGKKYTYYDTGTVNTLTELNGATPFAGTTFNYASSPSTCNFAFPSSVTMPVTTLVSSTTWDCNGAKPTQTTGFNSGQSTSYTWDSLWRSTGFTDPLGNTITTGYTAQTAVESYMDFNQGPGGVYQSLIDGIVTTDSLGRPQVRSHRQGPNSPQVNNYEAVETDYDADGRPSRTTMPYVASSGYGTNSSAPGVTTTYDGAGRPLTVKEVRVDTNPGQQINYSYSYNDVLITVSETNGSPPAGEHDKARQLEYDGLGRLISVCEILTSGGSSCGQNTSASGYLTKYVYSTNSSSQLTLTVTQNANGTATEQRTYVYDALGRLFSETNPESGTTAYTYDSDSSCSNTSPGNPGDLVKRTDAAGNSICYYHDVLHRLTDVGDSGQNASGLCERLRYDYTSTSPTVDGSHMQNSLGRLAETWRDDCVHQTKISDEGFSYDLDGHLTDIYQSTPHSSGYYHLTTGYFANGAVSSVNGVPQLPQINYGPFNNGAFYFNLDGEGRPTSVTDGNSTTLLNSISYSTANPGTSGPPLDAITQITYGTGDVDNFSYDVNNGRLLQYLFTVGTGTQNLHQATLQWNGNGSLSVLNVAKDFSNGNTQTCTYSHDDLGRISGVGCGSKWSQTFSYDPFGNLTKTGNQAFGCSTCYTGNRYNGFYYDVDGNITSDNPPTINYTWDAEGHATNIHGVTLIYDALGRMVEQQHNPGDPNCTVATDCTEIIYSPDGNKLALMNGQNLAKAYVPLPGGATAVYGPPISSGYANILYYMHSDWLGSSRVASSLSRTVLYDGAYAPFGESYAEVVNSGTAQSYHSFTGQNEDTVQGLDDFLFREYSSAQQGRWISPDPAGMSAVDVTNPQSWNRYAYVLNGPLGAVDLLGLMTNCTPSQPQNCPPPPPPTPPDNTNNGPGGQGGCGTPDGLMIIESLTPCQDAVGTWDRFWRDHFKEKPKPKPNPNVCGLIKVPTAPPGVSLNDNIAWAEGHKITALFSGEFNAMTWVNRVRPRGGWDYRYQFGNQYEDFGNFNFGATGVAIGFDPVTVLRGAGWAQELGNVFIGSPLNPSQWGSPGNPVNPSGGSGPYFGDDPSGFDMDVQGQIYYSNNCNNAS